MKLRNLLLFLLLPLVSLLLLFFSCRKETTLNNSGIQINPKSIQKIMLDRNFDNILTTKYNDTLVAHWTPDWQNVAYQSHMYGGTESIYAFIPLIVELRTKDNARTYKAKEYNQKKFVVAVQQGESLDVIFAHYVTDNSDVRTGMLNFNDKINFRRFSGSVILNNLKDYSNHFSYHDGKAVAKTKLYATKVANTKVITETANECVTTCQWGMYCSYGQEQEGYHIYATEEYGLDCKYPPTPPCSSMRSGTVNAAPNQMQLLESTTRCTDPNYPVPIPPKPYDPFNPFPLPGTLPAPGGINMEILPIPTGKVEINHPSTIKSELNNKCLIKGLNSVTNEKLKNWVSATVNEMFGEQSNIDMVFREKTRDKMSKELNGRVAMGQFNMEDSQINSATVNGKTYLGGKVYIDLNVDDLPRASYEYITTVVMHEAIHAILYAHGIHFISVNNQQHERMAAIYTKQMSLALKEIYPAMSEDDRNAVIWAGLTETLVDTSDLLKDWLRQFGSATDANILPNIKRHKVLLDYQEGRKGTISECL